MKTTVRVSSLFAGAAVIAAASFALGAETRKPLVHAYSTLADTILGAKKTEANLVRSILDSHASGARQAFRNDRFEECAADMALFANEGDNHVGGIRKRLLEGGHHHNAEGEKQGIYDEGFVIVTKKNKAEILAASQAMLAAKDAPARKAALDAFEAVAGAILKDK